MTTSISSLFQAGLFRKHDFVVSQLKHLSRLSIPMFIGTPLSLYLYCVHTV